jgi:Ca2+-binding EF-hand superfamily protein
MKTELPEKLPVPYLTAITKKYNKERALHEEDKFIQRFITQKGFVSTTKIADYLRAVPSRKRGEPLPEESIRRIFTASATAEGKLTADGLLKMAEEVGVQLSDKEAVDLIKRYGKRKHHLSVEDCLRLNARHPNAVSAKSLKKGR